MNIKDFINRNAHGELNPAWFEYYRSGVMYYQVWNTSDKYLYRFPIRLDDVGNGTLDDIDKAIFFMRWIRKAIESGEIQKLYSVDRITVDKIIIERNEKIS